MESTRVWAYGTRLWFFFLLQRTFIATEKSSRSICHITQATQRQKMTGYCISCLLAIFRVKCKKRCVSKVSIRSAQTQRKECRDPTNRNWTEMGKSHVSSTAQLWGHFWHFERKGFQVGKWMGNTRLVGVAQIGTPMGQPLDFVRKLHGFLFIA